MLYSSTLNLLLAFLNLPVNSKGVFVENEILGQVVRFFLLKIAIGVSEAQVLHFKDSLFGSGIPFVVVDKMDRKPIAFSNLDGNLKVSDTAQFKKWVFFHPEYYQIKYRIQQNAGSDTIHVVFENNDFNKKAIYTDKISHQTIERVLLNKTKNEPSQHAPLYYESYNKYHLSTTNLLKLKASFDKLLNRLKLKSIKPFEKEHHILLSETYTRKSYLNKNNDEETIEAIQVAGIESPTLSTVNSQFQSYSIYDPFIKILAKEYTNPLNKNTFRRYHFQTIKTFVREKDTLLIVKASPKATTLVETINAYYYINTSDNAIEAAILFPSAEKKMKIRVYKQYQKEKMGTYFPKGFQTVLKATKANNTIGFLSVSENRFFNFKTDTSFRKIRFTELAVRRGDDFGQSNKSLLEKHRKIALTPVDKNTFEFYDTLGNFKYFKNVADFAEKVYFKHIPLKKIDFVFDRTFGLNDYEGLRVGLGVQTNKNVSKYATLGAYAAYGYRDDKEKIGGRLVLHPPSSWNFRLGIAAQNDVEESGRSTFLKDRYQHPTEWQRKLKVGRFDRVKEVKVFAELNPLKYLDLYAGVLQNTTTPLYTYSFKGEMGSYSLQELHLRARYAFGLRYFQLNEERVPLTTSYPILWFNYTRGMQTFQYHILEAKIQYSINILGLGKSFFQFGLGQASGNLPYMKLFNGQGSEGFRSVIHNSFETMGYNEFVSSRYLQAFYSHQFGTLHLSKRFKPKAEVAFNACIGGLSNRTRHQGIAIKTLEDGFFETGFLLTNLIQINTSVVKINLGTGYYYRFGPNSFDSVGENSVLKFVTQIGF